MSREIKYRGIVEGSMWHASPESDRWQQFWVLADKETIGQYIGLKDRNGKEIYQDDIIKFGKSDGIIGWGRVYFNDGCFVHSFQEWFYNEKKDKWEPETGYWRPPKQFFTNKRIWIEVIGNIHTDPEPLRPKTAKS